MQEWKKDKQYQPGDVVEFGGKQWECEVGVKGVTPDEHLWKVLDEPRETEQPA